jgi:3-methyladenine DNA glycosylase Mpg
MAMGITLRENRVDLGGNRLRIEDRGIRLQPVRWGPRVGIRVGVDRLWRAYAKGCPAVSKT